MASEDLARNNAGIPPKYQVETKPRRKGVPVQPENVTPPDQAGHAPMEVYKTRVFQDHRGIQCLSCYRDFVKGSQEPLVPPWSYQFYIVIGLDFEHSSSEATRFCSELYEILIRDLSHEERVYMRFDFTCLPAETSNIDCMRHYWAEKTSSSRQQGDLALVPSYVMEGRAKGRSAENALVIVDDKDVQAKGLVWLKFGAPETYPVEAIPENMNHRTPRKFLGRLNAGFVGETMTRSIG